MRTVLLVAAFALLGCTKAQIVDLTMVSARHTPHIERRVGAYEILAGDMHCHVLPPDAPYHVSRTFEETVRIATDEGLDFVVLTPHVPRRFFLDPAMRDWVRRTQAILRAKSDAVSSLVVIPGMEYTDHEYGHLGLSFADVGAVLDVVSVEDALARPELFFKTWHAKGGLETINHPFLGPLPRAPVAELHYDLSWRGFFTPNVPPEIQWLTKHADAVETWNESVGHVRDRWFLGDPDWELRQATHLVDRLARAEERRIAPVGGSDSHGQWLRPTTFVLAMERSPAAIRDAIANGRTCVRGPEGCTLEARADGDWMPVGSSLKTNGTIEVRAIGDDPTYFLNGEIVAGPRITVTGACSVVRVAVNESMSAPIYVDCPQSMMGPPFSSAR